MIGFVADAPDQLELQLYSDADFAGDRAGDVSTSAMLLVLRGPRAFFPLRGISYVRIMPYPIIQPRLGLTLLVRLCAR